MNVLRPECEEHPSRPIARYARPNQMTMLRAFILLPRSDLIIGRKPSDEPRKRASASRSSWCRGIIRPWSIFAAQSLNSKTVPTVPCGSRTISQVRFAISAARRPAFTENKTITRSRSGYRVVSANCSRSSIWSADKIFACLPGIKASTRKAETDSSCKNRSSKRELAEQSRLRTENRILKSYRVPQPVAAHHQKCSSFIDQRQESIWGRHGIPPCPG